MEYLLGWGTQEPNVSEAQPSQIFLVPGLRKLLEALLARLDLQRLVGRVDGVDRAAM